MNKQQLQEIREHHNPNGRPLIVELRNTGNFAPSSWEGKTLDGRMVYIRYRFGTLKLYLGDVPDGDVMTLLQDGHELYVEMETSGTGSPSHMNELEMKNNLNDFVRFHKNV